MIKQKNKVCIHCEADLSAYIPSFNNKGLCCVKCHKILVPRKTSEKEFLESTKFLKNTILLIS